MLSLKPSVETVVSPRVSNFLHGSQYTVIGCGIGAPDRCVRQQSDRNGTTGFHRRQGRDSITIVAVMMAATGARLDGQDLRIDPTESAAIRVSVETLSRHVHQFAGLRVRVADAVVDRVVSPRAFLLVGQRDVAGLGGRERVGVVVASGTAIVVKAMPVVVTGAAGTFVGAQVFGILTRSEALTEQSGMG
jgi:hypothetical protein